MDIIFLLYCLLFFFAGFKFEVGTDYNAYKHIYEISQIEPYDSVYGIEPGFWMWMTIFGKLSVGFIGFMAITTGLNLGLKFYTFGKLVPYMAPALLIYFVGLFIERDFDGIRQGLAIGICYIALIPYLKKQYFLYYLIVVCAIFFHYTSFVFLFLPFIANLRFSIKFIVISLIAGVILVLLKIDLISTLLAAMPPSVLKDKIDAYILLKDELYLKATGLSIGILFRISVLIIFAILGEKLFKDPRQFLLYRNVFFVGIMISLIFNSIDILSHRLAYGFREFQIFILPCFMLLHKSPFFKLTVLTILYLYCMVLLYRLLETSEIAEYYHYKNYFLK